MKGILGAEGWQGMLLPTRNRSQTRLHPVQLQLGEPALIPEREFTVQKFHKTFFFHRRCDGKD